MKLISVLILILSISIFTHAGTFTTHDTHIPVAELANGTENGNTQPASTSKILLDARVYIPDGVAAPAPVLILVHGYAGSKNDSKVVELADFFASEGYVVLTYSVRGFGQSDGLVSLVGPNEVSDLKAIILRMQSGSIGRMPAVTIPVNDQSAFGVAGGSYGGGHAFEIVRTQVHGLKAVAPIIGWTDLYQALAPNDVPKLSFALGLFAGGFDPANPNYSPQMFDWLEKILSGNPEEVRTGDAQDNIDWRSVIFDPARLNVPTFVIQGWRDFLFPAEQAISLFETLTAIPFFKRYIGGLGHPPATFSIDSQEGQYLLTQLRRWFDFWLKGINTGIVNEPRVTIAPERTIDWSAQNLTRVNVFPVPGTQTRTLYLNAETLSTVGPGDGPRKVPPSTSDISVFDPILNALGGDASDLLQAVLDVNDIINDGAGTLFDSAIFTKIDENASKVTYKSEVLAAPLLVTGLPGLRLYVNANGPEAYYFVQIQERFPNGNTRLVTRGAFKDHTAQFQTTHLIEFSPFAINHQFQAGSQITLRISSRDFPFFLPNLDQPGVKIFSDADHPSSVLLPVR